MTDLNIGVIGVGEMGRRHAENVRRNIPGARLVAIADADPVRAAAVASELGVESVYASGEEIARDPRVDAVIISSPPKFHAPAMLAAASARKHIFCEKPIALTLEDADAALDAVSGARVFLQVGHMRRYDAPYVEAKNRIDAGEIGHPVIFKSIGRDQETPPSAAAQTDLNGTLFHDSSSHDFDLARWLMGDEIAEVHAYGAALAIPAMSSYQAFDSGVVNLQFVRGAIGNVESFMDAKYGYDIRTEVVGTKGTIQVGQMRRTPLVRLDRGGSTHDLIGHWLVRFDEAYRAEIADFVQRILTGRPPLVTGYDGRQSLAVAVAAVQSHRERRPVPVNQDHRAKAQLVS